MIHEIADADALGRGEVLVVRQVTPEWAPLLARARAVAADVGGAAEERSLSPAEFHALFTDSRLRFPLLVRIEFAVQAASSLGLVPFLVLVLLSIEVSDILPTLPGQPGTFEAAVLGATAGFLGQAEALALRYSSMPNWCFPRSLWG
ncbi:hypothetical protein [Streptomyces sp. NPDC102462]|uniref:hypothetical protein n=1 Tax=Streptomyces sp. NPDC102462 TaxID=3366178 RepID=UPI00381642B4